MEGESEISEHILEMAKKATEELYPKKSRAIYDKEFKIFINWKLKNGISVVNETVMLAYFNELSEKYNPNSMWTKYSILKSTLLVNENFDISHYNRLVSFLKQKAKGYTPKKSKILTGEQVLSFLKEAPNENHLLHKVILVMGLFGGMRRDEMVNLTINNVEDQGSVILVKLPKNDSGADKSFKIVQEDAIGALKLVRQYVALRSLVLELKEPRFFVLYRNNHCYSQPVGKNTIGSVPKIIAKFLKLDNANEYNGHCLRRTTFESLKLHSTAVSVGYVEKHVSNNHVVRNIESSVRTFGESSLSSCQNSSLFNMDNKCRTCLEERGSLQSIFSVDEGSKINISFADIINTSISSSVHIRQKDGLPDKICLNCSKKLSDFYKFKLNLEKNELFLKSQSKNISHNVTEIKSFNSDASEVCIKEEMDLDEIDSEVNVFVKQEILHPEIMDEEVDKNEYDVHIESILETDISSSQKSDLCEEQKFADIPEVDMNVRFEEIVENNLIAGHKRVIVILPTNIKQENLDLDHNCQQKDENGFCEDQETDTIDEIKNSANEVNQGSVTKHKLQEESAHEIKRTKSNDIGRALHSPHWEYGE